MTSDPAPKTQQNSSDKTEVLGVDQETLNKEISKAREQPACLILIRGAPQGHRFSITQDQMVIGRDPNVEISISDPSISRKHARLRLDGSSVKLEDLGSANGTVVNGNRLSPGDLVALEKEDMIKLGNTIVKFLPAGELEIIFYGNLNAAANNDPLTGAFNKGYFIEAIDAEFKRARALHTQLSLVFMDLDHFKKVNDTYGHEGGDYVLKEFANLIRTLPTHGKEVFARYGGEEFCLLLPSVGKEEAAKLAELVRSKIQLHPFIYEGKRIHVTSSLGVSELKSETEGASSLIKEADKALYESKTSGRNRVTVAY